MNLQNNSFFFIYQYCAVVNHKWKIDPVVDKELNEGKYKHKGHPGAMAVSVVKLPNQLGEAIQTVNERKYNLLPTYNLYVICEFFLPFFAIFLLTVRGLELMSSRTPTCYHVANGASPLGNLHDTLLTLLCCYRLPPLQVTFGHKLLN